MRIFLQCGLASYVLRPSTTKLLTVVVHTGTWVECVAQNLKVNMFNLVTSFVPSWHTRKKLKLTVRTRSQLKF